MYRRGDRFEGIFSLAAIINETRHQTENYHRVFCTHFLSLLLPPSPLFRDSRIYPRNYESSKRRSEIREAKRHTRATQVRSHRLGSRRIISSPGFEIIFPVSADQSDGNHAGIIAARECPLPPPPLPDQRAGGEGRGGARFLADQSANPRRRRQRIGKLLSEDGTVIIRSAAKTARGGGRGFQWPREDERDGLKHCGAKFTNLIQLSKLPATSWAPPPRTVSLRPAFPET